MISLSYWPRFHNIKPLCDYVGSAIRTETSMYRGLYLFSLHCLIFFSKIEPVYLSMLSIKNIHSTYYVQLVLRFKDQKTPLRNSQCVCVCVFVCFASD